MLVAAAVMGLATGRAAVAQERPKSVLALYSVREDSPTATGFGPILQQAIGEGPAGHVDYYAEFIDLARFPEPNYREDLWSLFRSKYEGRRFDLIVVAGDAILDLLRAHRDEPPFADTPVVFSIASDTRVPANATGLIARLTFRDTLESAVSLQPGTTRVVVVSGASAFDKYYEAVARSQFKPLEGRLEFTYLSALPAPELLQQVARLPEHSIVFFTGMSEDGDGQRFLLYEMLDRVSAASNVPTYGWNNFGMGHGIVGGKLSSSDLLEARTAELALRVLRGENPASIPVGEIDWSATEFDWRQLKRWGIADARLPRGSRVLYRQPGGWDLYGGYIVGGSALVGLQSALIAGLLLRAKYRKRVELLLRESEERFRLAADTAPVLIWRAGTDMLCDFVNRPWLEFTGRALEEELGNGWAQGIFPEERDRCLRTYASAFEARQSFEMEYRHRRADGAYRWILTKGVPRFGSDGTFAGFIGSCVDITERKLAEGEREYLIGQLRHLAGRLIAAQDTERTRIARDLHDDTSQQLAGAVDRAQQPQAPDGRRWSDEDQLQADLSALQQRTATLAAERPSPLARPASRAVLHHGGLVAALTSHCAELQRSHGCRS